MIEGMEPADAVTSVFPPELAGRSAFVTGASSGLGRHMALLLARAGMKVAIAARRTDRLLELASEIQRLDGRALAIKLDVTDEASVKRAVGEAEDELGPIRLLVNNSGLAIPKPALEITAGEWDSVFATNLRGAFLMAQEIGRHMARAGQGGSIVNIASILGTRVTNGLASYAASKAGLIQVTHALAHELARHAIRVNAIAPGYIATEMNRDYLAGPAGEAMRKRIPLRRFGEPADLEGALLLLASDAARYITGTVITIDGGHSLGLA
jgi:NAD(P)-dependent dehydrogenase (short-subunit alcohol dehydrogenase family)